MNFVQLRLYLLACICAMLAACGGGGGIGSSNCTDIISVDGEPDMTGAPSFSASTVTAGDSLTLTIPIDMDVAHIILTMVSDLRETNINIVPVTNEAVTPGNQAWQYQLDTTGYTPGSYYMDVDLCTDPNSCANASTGIGVAYSVMSLNNLVRYSRRHFWNNGSIQEDGTESCITIPYVRIN